MAYLDELLKKVKPASSGPMSEEELVNMQLGLTDQSMYQEPTAAPKAPSVASRSPAMVSSKLSLPATPSAPAAKEDAGYGDDLNDAALKRAQGDSEANRRNALLMLAGNQMNEAFSGAKVDNRAIDELLKTANMGEKNIEARRSGKDQEMARLLKSYEAATAKEQSTAGSSISKASRDLYKKWTGKDIAETVTARELKDTLVLAEKSYYADLNASKGRDDKADKLELKKEMMGRLSDKQLSMVANYDKSLDIIKTIIEDKSKFDTGPVAGRWHTMAGWVGMNDAKKAAFKAEVGDQLAQYIKSISGAAVSEQEAARLIANLPTMNDNDEQFISKLNTVRERLEQGRRIDLDLMGKQGKQVAQYSNSDAQRSPGGNGGFPKTVTNKDGRTATVSNQKEADDAKSEGFQ